MKKEKHTARNVIIILLALILVMGGTVYGLFLHYYGKTNYVPDREVTEGTLPPEEESQVLTLPPEVESSIQEEVVVTEESVEEEVLTGTYSLLLVGADRRDTSWNGNSDAMILVTVNNNNQTLTLTSFMRDLYANIEGVGVRKLNHAYAIGGGPKLVQTLQSNYGVAIDNYAAVDFEGLKAIVDRMGGVDVEIKAYELATMRTVGIDTAGMHHLNGKQALTYARIRHQGNSDFERTQRQRVVLQALMSKARSMSAGELAALADEILPYVTHNMDQGTVIAQLTKLPTYLKYEVREIRIPEDGTWYSQAEILIPKDINEVIRGLRERLYGD